MFPALPVELDDLDALDALSLAELLVRLKWMILCRPLKSVPPTAIAVSSVPRLRLPVMDVLTAMAQLLLLVMEKVYPLLVVAPALVAVPLDSATAMLVTGPPLVLRRTLPM